MAVDAIKSSSSPHRFLSVTKHNIGGIVSTRGNKGSHLILRGGRLVSLCTYIIYMCVCMHSYRVFIIN